MPLDKQKEIANMMSHRTGRPRKDKGATTHHLRLQVDHELYVEIAHKAVDEATTPSEILRRAFRAYCQVEPPEGHEELLRDLSPSVSGDE